MSLYVIEDDANPKTKITKVSLAIVNETNEIIHKITEFKCEMQSNLGEREFFRTDNKNSNHYLHTNGTFTIIADLELLTNQKMSNVPTQHQSKTIIENCDDNQITLKIPFERGSWINFNYLTSDNISTTFGNYHLQWKLFLDKKGIIIKPYVQAEYDRFKVWIRYEITVKDINGQPMFITEDNRQLLAGVTALSCVEGQRISQINIIDTCTIKCIIKPLNFYISLYQSIQECMTANTLELSDNSITKDFMKLFKSKENSDVTLMCAAEHFSVHKLVLSTRSSVFNQLFQLEQKKTIFNITNVDGKTLKNLLQYIYTDYAPDIKEIGEELFRAAKYYQLPGLIEICEYQLAEQLCLKSVARVLVLADTHKSGYLKKAAFNFIETNGSELIDTESFKKLLISKPELSYEILQNIMKK